MKTELWNNHEIRFVEVDGEWLAVAKDVSVSLEYANATKAIRDHIEDEDKIMGVQNVTPSVVDELGRNQYPTLITEFGIYDLIFNSKMPQAKQFKRWVFNVIKQLRVTVGLEGFEIFRTLDKEHQRRAMNQLCQSLSRPVRLDFMKANTIANKAVSTKFGYPKMVKKGEMTPDMLKSREAILEDTVSLMGLQDKYHMNLSISQTIYDSLNSKQTA